MESRPGPYFSSPVRALVIDDDPREMERIRRCFSEAFGANGTTIDHAASVGDAAARARESRYDVFIVDYACALDGGGAELLRILHADEGAPVILLAGLLHEEIGRRAVRAGLKNVIVKSSLEAERFVEAMLGA